MFESSNLPFVLLAALFLFGIVMTLTAGRRAASAAMKKRVVHNIVFQGDERVGLLRCGAMCSDPLLLREAFKKVPSSFIKSFPSPDVRNVVAASARELPKSDRENVFRARLAEYGLRLELFEVLVDTEYDEGCRRLQTWAASPCKYGKSNIVLSCSALELWLDAQSRLSMWVHKANGTWTFERPLRFKKEDRPLWVYKVNSGSGTKTPKTFDAMRAEAA